MNNPTTIINTSGELSLMFPTAGDALIFIKSQSSNPAWLDQWEISVRFHKGETICVARTSQPVNVTLPTS